MIKIYTVTFEENIADELFRYAVIISRYDNKWVFVKHKNRNTIECPGGRREAMEAIENTAKRELFEETGALAFAIHPICPYTVRNSEKQNYGMIYFASINKLGELPNYEIESVHFYNSLPIITEWTYPEIQPLLFDKFMNTVTVRQAQADDYTAICNLNSKAFGYEFPVEQTRQRLEHILLYTTDKILIACFGFEAKGYIHLENYNCTYAMPLINIMAIAVDTEMQGRGVGKKLLQAAEDWAKDNGAYGIRLVSGENRIQAHGFYEHCGYSLRKKQKNFVKYF